MTQNIFSDVGVPLGATVLLSPRMALMVVIDGRRYIRTGWLRIGPPEEIGPYNGTEVTVTVRSGVLYQRIN